MHSYSVRYFISLLLKFVCFVFNFPDSEGNTKEMQQAVSAQLSEAAFQEKSGFKSLA